MIKLLRNFIALETKKTTLTKRLTLIFITPIFLVIGLVTVPLWIIYEESRYSLLKFFKEVGPMLKSLYKEYW